MRKNIEEIKQKMKNEYAKKVDEYFSQYDELVTSGKVDINSIETLLGDGITSAKEVLINATEEMIKPELDNGASPDNKKKHVPPVENQ